MFITAILALSMFWVLEALSRAQLRTRQGQKYSANSEASTPDSQPLLQPVGPAGQQAAHATRAIAAPTLRDPELSDLCEMFIHKWARRVYELIFCIFELTVLWSVLHGRDGRE